MSRNKKIIIFGIGLIVACTFLVVSISSSDNVVEDQKTTEEELAANNVGQKPIDNELIVNDEPKNLRQFTPDEFKELFDSLSLPNTVPIIEAPYITGDYLVDSKIQEIAEKRGYILRSVPGGLLNEFEGIQLQELLIADWKNLVEEAKLAGFDLKIRSGYRSVDEQRQLFMDELNIEGVQLSEIPSGAYDLEIDQLLQRVAPPGYSRHHHGYTVDVYVPDYSVFEYSTAYAWLKANNFEVAKKHGFIPSYPEGVTKSGPNPEPWEYVWANKDFVVE